MKTKNKFTNVFDALEDDSLIADNLKLRARMMHKLCGYIEKNKITQKNAAMLMNVAQPRISDLVCGKIDKFTIDMLINMLSKAGTQVDFVLKKAA